MTFAELDRYCESRQRVINREEQKQASFDYILADLIGRSISRTMSSSNKMPGITEAYPNLFNTEEIQEKLQKKKEDLSAIRFKQFALSYNKRFKEVGNKE